MLSRCYSERYLSKHQSYIGSSVCDEWLKFSNFKKWMQSQDWRGKQLDKDFLSDGQRVYSPDTCIFISGALNKFLTDNAASRGPMMLGVVWVDKRGRYHSQCRNPFTRRKEFLGAFIDEISAHRAWLSKKHQHACRYADMQEDPRVAQALRARYLPRKESC